MLGIERAFIQASAETGMPFDETAFAVWSGCRSLGIETKLFCSMRDIDDLRRTTFIHAGVPHFTAVLNLLEVPMPEVSDYPESLRFKAYKLFGRDIRESTLEWLRFRRRSDPVFIKPRYGSKIFNGFIYRSTIEDQLNLNTFSNDTPIWESDVVNFVSEYRVLVHQGLIIACRHYKGDCSIFPDLDVATAAINCFDKAPCGYALDLGITDGGRTLIVEINDAWALGCYGTPSIPYTEMVINRWKEIVGC